MLLIPVLILLLGCYPPPTPVAAPAASPAAQTRSGGARLAWTKQVGEVINWSPQLLASGGQALLVVAAELDAVVALDSADGRELWRYQPGQQLWADSVTVVGEDVFVASAGGEAQMLDGATGQPLWQVSLQPAVGAALPGLEARGRPAWTDDTLFVPTAGVGSRALAINPELHAPLVALDRATGAERWRFTSDNYILRAPFVDAEKGAVYVGGARLADADIDEGGQQRIYALDMADGQLRWTYDSPDGLTKSLWAGDGTVVFVAYRDFLAGIDSSSGEERWRETSGNWVQSFAALSGAGTGPAIGYGSANGFLNLIDPADGRLIWRFNLPGVFNYPMGSVVEDNGAVYFITQQGELYALDGTDGGLLWMTPTGLESRDGVAVGAGRLFVASADGTVHAFDLP